VVTVRDTVAGGLQGRMEMESCDNRVDRQTGTGVMGDGFSVVCDPEGTAAAAAALAPMLGPGDALVLRGGLAAGKTFFVKALVRALGSGDEVTSPTFTIAQFYHLPAGGTFLHVDAYRLENPLEYRDLGLDEYMEDAIAAVEWGDRIEGELPDHLTIGFEPVSEGEELRRLTFSAAGERWAPVLERLRTTLAERAR
jgi:tRNA threonylcarbamoyladenosine biosynthesis protein TsaE